MQSYCFFFIRIDVFDTDHTSYEHKCWVCLCTLTTWTHEFNHAKHLCGNIFLHIPFIAFYCYGKYSPTSFFERTLNTTHVYNKDIDSWFGMGNILLQLLCFEAFVASVTLCAMYTPVRQIPEDDIYKKVLYDQKEEG